MNHTYISSFFYIHSCSKPTLEGPLEHVARTRAVTKGVRHLEGCK